ncbi:hypothetical protein DFQ28_011749 [Apophysomyces sp. BC1034]|nr:hypothetical protein DFQ30_000235 [Apophysomyces sp. BC1015]KAG0168441.1 hypothetical protein DFQ29_010150 [Apophysomyces sp. BC1021]KAG0184119.1 hypothetical protein DFQ28_011749 [Apophysomyces sp. BC1034]
MTLDSPIVPKPPNKVDFLIVGAGPVGLLAANLILKAGFTVRILDVEFEPNHWGRGDWIHGRTLELLERVGLVDELMKTGVKVEKMSSYSNGQLQAAMPFVPDQVESKHQYLLCVGQHITESSLQSRLSEYDIQVERPSTVMKMAKNKNNEEYPLRATVMHMKDQAGTEEVECKYLLGCDGAHSDIRNQLKIQNEGVTTETHAGVLDALVRTNFHGRKDVCILQSDAAKTVSLFPRENGLTRIFVHFNENEHDLRKEQHNRNKIQLEDIQREAKRALLPNRLEFLGILYWSVYVVGQRMAADMDAFDHRVFLCGDAAHSQSPTLGQGVNTGFGDIFNLIWKLCLVERRQISREVVATYTTERRPVAQEVLAVDKRAAKSAAGNESDSYCKIVEENRAFITGFGIRYQDKTDTDPLLWNSSTSNSGVAAEEEYVLQPGMRAPDYKVVLHSTGKKARLFEYQKDTKIGDWLTFSLLVLAGDIKKSKSAVTTFLSWRTKAMDQQNKLLVADTDYLIVTTSSADVVTATCEEDAGLDKQRIVLDKLNRAQCHTGYQADSETVQIVVVRPDGYIGTILRSHSGQELADLTQKYFDRFHPK